MKQIASADIQQLLKLRHSKDVYIPECATNARWRNARRLDAWVMRKSWAHPLTIGYEIKVSRADFIQDSKWRDYLNYCNEFYFVCPAGVIEPNELSPEVGLLLVSKTKNKLLKKKRATYRNVIIPESLYRYILMKHDYNNNG